jgi:hypothetical protein
MLLLVVEQVLDVVLVHFKVDCVENSCLHTLDFQTVMVWKLVFEKLVFVQRVEAFPFQNLHPHVMLCISQRLLFRLHAVFVLKLDRHSSFIYIEVL